MFYIVVYANGENCSDIKYVPLLYSLGGWIINALKIA